ncbi:MAG: hypothetical protein KTR31_41875 [Myxococcales bacterium]|nr:hypothetical protein [Myxococcales bacterium]
MRPIALATTILALTACQSDVGFESGLVTEPVVNPLPPDEQEITDTILQTVTPSVSILFMVDNSCSMSDDQDELAKNFPSFMNWFLGSGLDYHIGVISSDMQRNSDKGKLVRARGKLWITKDDNDQIGFFRQLAVLGAGGTFPERGTGAVFNSMEDSAAVDHNRGFFRDGSAIHTVAVSDEKDYSEPEGDITTSEFTNWYDGLRRDPDQRTFSSIENPDAFSYVAGGKSYGQVTSNVGGVFYDLRDDDWARALDRLGVQVSGHKTEYFLSQLPKLGTVEVTANVPQPDGQYVEFLFPQAFEQDGMWVDAEGNPADDDAWYYSEGRNSISFLDYVPPDLAQVSITYIGRTSGFSVLDDDG